MPRNLLHSHTALHIVSFEEKYRALLQKAEHSWIIWLFLTPLLCLSYVYRAAVFMNRCVRKLTFKPAPLAVITVGNIVAGGTGKTPLIKKLLGESAIHPEKSIYISRGYKSRASGRVDPSSGSLVDSCVFGDEAALLARHYPDLLFMKAVAGKARAVQEASRYSSRTLAIVDDALQHDEIDFKLTIATVDSMNPYGFGWMLPRGFLREPPQQRLRNVDYIVLTNAAVDDDQFQQVWDSFSKEYNKPLIAMKSVFCRFFNEDGQAVDPQQLAPIAPVVVTAIAKPLRCVKLIEEALKMPVCSFYFFSDHEEIDISRVNRWIETLKHEPGFQGKRPIVFSTEKDWVKKSSWKELSVPIYFVEMSLEVVRGEQAWKECVKRCSTYLFQERYTQI